MGDGGILSHVSDVRGQGKYVILELCKEILNNRLLMVSILCLCDCCYLPRPQNEQFYKDNGLSMELVHGCRNVLRERQVLKQLMNKCEGIARKMTKDISQVIENGMGSMKQPTTLNSK